MIYTVGHSTLSEEDFLDLIEPLDQIWDIRSHPGSKWPQFNKEYLETFLPAHNIEYNWEPRLGGWSSEYTHYHDEYNKYNVDVAIYSHPKFPKQRIAKDWTHKSLDHPLCPVHGCYQPTSISPDICTCVELRKNKEIYKEFPYWSNVGLWDFQWFMTLNEFMQGADFLIDAGQHTNIGIMCCELTWWRCHRSMVADYLHVMGVDAVHLQPKETQHSQILSNRLDRYHPEVLAIWDGHKKAINLKLTT